MNKLISIIIPVFNTEKYIKNCVNSVINQNYKNIEIILIDDGSTDKSSIYCDELLKIDERIRVIHQKNSGQSAARNLGIEISKGDYICFIDSDDYVDPNFVKTLLSNMINTNSDMSLCSYLKVSNHNTYLKSSFEDCICYNKNECYEHLVMDNDIAGYVWNKLYSIRIIKKMEKPYFKDCFVEDFEFNARYLNYCNKVCYDTNKLYYYFINNEGETQTFKLNQKIIDGIKAYDLILREYDKNKITASDYVAYNALKYRLNINYRINKLSYETDMMILDDKLYRRIIKSKVIRFRDKIIIYVTYKMPILSYKLKYKLKRR